MAAGCSGHAPRNLTAGHAFPNIWDGNGRIDDGSELFGSNTRLGSAVAKHGFEALAQLDGNADGLLDARDPLFGAVLVWRDSNGDRRSQPLELTTLAQNKVTSISLDFSDQPRCDARGNCERQRATFAWSGRRGAVVDVYLKVNAADVRARATGKFHAPHNSVFRSELQRRRLSPRPPAADQFPPNFIGAVAGHVDCSRKTRACSLPPRRGFFTSGAEPSPHVGR